MENLWGLVLGAGVFLVWWSAWTPPAATPSNRIGWAERTTDLLVQAGVRGVSPAGLVGVSVGVGVLALILGLGITASPPIAVAFAIIAGRAPFALVAGRARRRREAVRGLWPDVVDTLSSGIRAGLSLPEALAQVGQRGPAELREPFVAFGADYRASGRFNDSLNALKARLADPVADRIVEALRITREVGGSDIGRLLRTLAEFLREDARTRGELEARQSWTINAARLAVSAPWIVLLLLSTQSGNAAAFNSAAGVTVLGLGGALTVAAYRLMIRLGRLPVEARVLR
jgi:tight adherence protein B